ncbi:ribonucleoside-triphosphate reductase, adenosylcobalamin-dependent [Trichothermofontia sp.]
MVQELERTRKTAGFPQSAPTANPVFYRTYSRKQDGERESWDAVCDRTLQGLAELGHLTPEEVALLNRQQRAIHALPSGRWLWVGGTNWIQQPENFSGAYNCTSTNVTDWRAFGLMMDLAMMGCGTGAVLEPKYIEQLPPIRNVLQVKLQGEVGRVPVSDRREETEVEITGQQVVITVGDSRQGWVKSYQSLLELSTDDRFTGKVEVIVDLSHVRPAGEPLQGFGGVANPIKLSDMYQRCARILNKAVGRQLTSVECCLLIDEAAVTIVAGNIRRSAGMRQGDSEDEAFANAKANLWQQDEAGNWRIDPERDALRMANHTRVFHHKPTETECIEAVRKQFYSGEGAIQYAPEAIARANIDLLHTPDLKQEFLEIYTSLGAEEAKRWLKHYRPEMPDNEIEHRLQRYALNPCVTADTWVHTGEGPRQVSQLIGVQHSTYVNGELFSTTPAGFFYSGTKPVVKLQTQEGYTLRLTNNHRLLKVTAQTQKRQYTEWVEAATLQPGDRILLHNHRGLQPWEGAGDFESGWLLGCLISEASLLATAGHVGHGASTANASTLVEPWRKAINLTDLAVAYGIDPVSQTITPLVEQGSYAFYRGFLQAIFDADAQVKVSQGQSVSICLQQTNLFNLKAVQRMLARFGIIARLVDQNQHYELVILGDNLDYFQQWIGFQTVQKSEHLHQALVNYPCSLNCNNSERFSVTVATISLDGIEPVYDCTVPGPACFDANGFVAHNCGEIIGANFHCVAGDTLLITRDGLHTIQSLVGQSVEVWNGQRWSRVTPLMTGRNRQLYRVTFGDGTWLDVTSQHRFFVQDRFDKDYLEVTTEELKGLLVNHKYALHTEPFVIDYQDGKFVDPIWAYTLGQLVGDGSLCQSHGRPQLQLRLYGAKSYQSLAIAGKTSGQLRYYAENPDTPCLLYTGFKPAFDAEQVRQLKTNAHALEPLASWHRDGILHFIAGLIDADGSETGTGGVRLYISDYGRAYRLYLLLLKCGIRSSINLQSKAGSKTNLGIRQQDLWYLQITDCAAIPCQRVQTVGGHPAKMKGKWQMIRSVEPLAARQDTFCFNESEFHKGVFGGTLTGQCNLSEIHLNQLDPSDFEEQKEAFTAGALSVAVLLNHQFQEPRYQLSRQLDPIVGVSFTGLFDFFVTAFGVDWLRWWAAGRPDTPTGLQFRQQEQDYLTRWREIVHHTVWDYCDRHGIKRPNRCTTVQPAGTKSLLTGASPGWHPPKAQRFIRRITFRKNDPVALACLDCGYNVIPSQSDKDEHGNLLNDPFDPRCTEWLVELPVEVSWANLPEADTIDISKFSALAQFDFYMQVQRHWTTHNTSATIELREPEIEALGKRIYETIQNGEGYISAALLARFDDLQTFPRLPFEPISKETYDRMQAEIHQRRKTDDFHTALQRYDSGYLTEAGPAGCDSDKCLLPEQK